MKKSLVGKMLLAVVGTVGVIAVCSKCIKNKITMKAVKEKEEKCYNRYNSLKEELAQYQIQLINHRMEGYTNENMRLENAIKCIKEEMAALVKELNVTDEEKETNLDKAATIASGIISIYKDFNIDTMEQFNINLLNDQIAILLNQLEV